MSSRPSVLKFIGSRPQARLHELQSPFANSVDYRRASSNAEHERIVAATEVRDAAAAASAMTEHLDHVQSALASLSPRFHRLRSG